MILIIVTQTLLLCLWLFLIIPSALEMRQDEIRAWRIIGNIIIVAGFPCILGSSTIIGTLLSNLVY